MFVVKREEVDTSVQNLFQRWQSLKHLLMWSGEREESRLLVVLV